MNWQSQAEQDKWVCEYFNYKQGGYFLDMGAMDGLTSSNTYVLEKELNWNGICVECNPVHLNNLSKNRNCTLIKKGIWSKNGWYVFDLDQSQIVEGFRPLPTTIETITFKKLFENYKVPDVIDYISLDIEGAEYEALTAFPFETNISILWTIEHNLYLKNDATLKNKVKDIMLANNYVIAKENVGCFDTKGLPFEDWYVHKNYCK